MFLYYFLIKIFFKDFNWSSVLSLANSVCRGRAAVHSIWLGQSAYMSLQKIYSRNCHGFQRVALAIFQKKGYNNIIILGVLWVLLGSPMGELAACKG